MKRKYKKQDNTLTNVFLVIVNGVVSYFKNKKDLADYISWQIEENNTCEFKISRDMVSNKEYEKMQEIPF